MLINNKEKLDMDRIKSQDKFAKIRYNYDQKIKEDERQRKATKKFTNSSSMGSPMKISEL